MSKTQSQNLNSSQMTQPQNQRNTQDNIIIGLVVMIVMITLSVMTLLFFMAIIPPKSYDNVPLTTSRVRKLWRETGMANSKYYQFKEIESKVTDDTIYFTSEEISGEIGWRCRHGGSSEGCDMVFSEEGSTSGDINTLGGYFWEEHWAEIVKILEKYPGLSARSMSQIEVYDLVDLEKFAQEILEIPDIERLYRAYRAECKRSYDGRAAREFAYATVYFMGEGGETNGEKYLFSWMAVQGL